LRASLGTNGLVGFGACFGVLAAMVHRAGGRASRVARKAEDAEIAVAEEKKTELSKIAYLKNIPETIMKKQMLERYIASTPLEELENPPEDSPGYVLKMYAETYGPGKATKMGWYDFFYMKTNTQNDQPNDFLEDPETMKADEEKFRKRLERGEKELLVPVAFQPFDSGITFKWRGREPFAGDLMQEPVWSVGLSRGLVQALAFYRDGLKPWQRGLEIGMGHGYFLIGPFVSLGPLRNTPEAATVGLLAGCACVIAVSVGGLIFGATVKPTKFDKPGDQPAEGYNEMIRWHAIGGIGGAGFAHALLTIFGS